MKVIDVERVEGNFYGGLAYKASWSFGGESEPSKLIIDVVNERGEYGEPNINLTNLESISLGGFNFQGYLVAYSLNGTAEEKTLTLEYVDASINLDKYWVGLNKIHGDNGSEPPNVILLGKEYHPCDINMDSTVDYTEENVRLIDPCDPCPFSPPGKYKEACDPRNVDVDNFEVYYTFNELIQKITATIPNLNIDFSGDGFYMFKAQHIGNLRNVLSSWCSDLGLSFFWDPVQSKLILRSRSSFSSTASETYNSIKNNPFATEVNYREEVLGTFSQGFIGRFEKEGGVEDFECSGDTWKMLKPITIDDLFLPDVSPSNTLYDGEISARGVAVALSYYSSYLRGAFLWFVYYGITNAAAAKSYIDAEDQNNDDDGNNNDDNNNDSDDTPPSESGSGRTQVTGESRSGENGGNTYVASVSSYDAATFDYTVDDCGTIKDIKGNGDTKGSAAILKYWGGMRIRAVYSRNSEDPYKSYFTQLKNNMPIELQEIWKGADGTEDDPKYYFFVGESSEEGYDAGVSVDTQLAQNFLGRYYFNLFKTIITSATGNDATECDVQGSSGDGGGSWHRAQTGLENIEIFKQGHDAGSAIDNIQKDALEKIKENESTRDQRVSKSTESRNPEDFVANSYVLFSRSSPKWSPTAEESEHYGTLYSWCAQQLPHTYQDGDGRPDILYDIFPEAKWNQNIRLFIVKELSKDLTVEITREPHQLETLGGYKERIEEDVLGNQFTINEGPWGLLSKDCFVINFDGVMKIFVPPGAFEQELDNYADECVTAPTYTLLEEELYSPVPSPPPGPGYRVFVACRSIFPKLKKKMRYSMFIDAESANEVRKVDYVDYLLNEDNVSIFGNSCIPDTGLLKNYLSDLGKTSQYSYTNKLFDINFKLAGVVPETWSVEDGLSNLSVEVTENGVFTTYNLSTKIIQPPSISYMEQNFRNQKRQALGNRIGTMSSVKVKTIRH